MNSGDDMGQASGPKFPPQKSYGFFQKLRHQFFTAVSFSIFGVWGACLAWVFLPRVWRRTEGSDDEKARACRREVSAAFQYLFGFMSRHGLFRLSLPPADCLPKDGRFILIANHPSLIDMVALFSCFPEVVIVAASYMFRNPILGPLLHRCQFIDGGDGGPFSGASVISAGIERLERGIPVLIFPEGTRSPISGFGAFRRGAFEMSKRANAPLYPAYISTHPRTLMKGMAWHKIPAEVVDVNISVGDPMIPGEDETARALQKRVEAHYRQKLHSLQMIQNSSKEL